MQAKRRVMVVDDESSIRFTVKVVLGTVGIEVLPAESGKRCIEELEKGFRGVILLDMMMPGMDGWDTLKEINARGLSQGNIVSMFTARDIDVPQYPEMTETMGKHISKPFEFEELVDAVEECFASLLKTEGKAN